jgi:hypothetical protein
MGASHYCTVDHSSIVERVDRDRQPTPPGQGSGVAEVDVPVEVRSRQNGVTTCPPRGLHPGGPFVLGPRSIRGAPNDYVGRVNSVCLVYLEARKRDALTGSESTTVMDDCLIPLAAEALQPVEVATSLCIRDGKLDRDEAIQVASRIKPARPERVEVHPILDLGQP